MKTEKSSKIGKIVKNIFNIRAWSDFDRVRGFFLYIIRTVKNLFIPDQTRTGNEENYNEAVKRFDLSQEEMDKRQGGLWRLSLYMLILTIGFLIYSGYHFIFGSIRAGLVSLSLSLVSSALAFRYHFWYFQIKEKRLGCTFKEWLHRGLLGEKHD